MSEALALTKRQVERKINQLKAEGVLRREGSTKKGVWVINQ